MIYEFDSFEAYQEACERDPSLNGSSPGGSRVALGLTRQGIYNAVRRGALDLVRVYRRGEGPYLFIPEGSIKRYLLERRNRMGPKRKLPLRQTLIMIGDKHLHSAWPLDYPPSDN